MTRASLSQTVDVLGVTQPLLKRTARITTAIDGRVAALLPDAKSDHPSSTDADPTAFAAAEGQLVTERQIIVQLEDGLARANVAKSEATLAEAEAALELQKVTSEQQLKAAEAAVSSAKTATTAAEAQVKRLGDISKLVGPSQLADAKTALDKALADQRAAEAHLAELGQAPVARKAAELQAKVKAAQADLHAAQTQLDLTNIRSPIAGRLGKIGVFLGQSLPVGAPIATVTDLRVIEIEALLPAKQRALVKVGQPATIDWGAEPNQITLPGKVTFVGNEIEPGAGSFTLHIVADNPEEALGVGLHVHARIAVRQVKDVLAVPRSALVEETDPPYVFVAQKKEGALIAHRVNVRPGVVSGDLVQIEADGISAGDRVVTKGNYALPDGAGLAADQSAKSAAE